MLRSEAAGGSELGKLAQGYMSRGDLVPDDVIIGMIKTRLEGSAGGMLLDGFPRTIPQVESLDGILEKRQWKRTAVILLTVADEELVRRISGRRSCEPCGVVTRVDLSGETCPECSGTLVQRADDLEDVVRERLRVYRTETAPMLEVYRQRKLLREIDGGGNEQQVHDAVMGSLKEAAA